MMMTENDTLLPQGLGTGAVIAHKTGNLRGVLADAGLVDVPNGQRYVVVALVERPEYDDRAVELIRELSARVYGYFARTRIND
jgi:beta-lactamase class A